MDRPDLTLAHVSDLHAEPPRPRLPAKRVLTWLSWRLHRGGIHRPEVLEALVQDLHRSSAEHVVVTGDLTNTGSEHECAVAKCWLERLGAPGDVTVVPGNHDALVGTSAWELWADYLGSDGGAEGDAPIPEWPSVRIRGPAAVIGLSSSAPTPVFDATGCLEADQLERLEACLVDLGARGLCRVILIHHPPHAGAAAARRSLRDGPALRRVLRRCGAELVLHGHLHRVSIAQLDGPSGPMPVVGVSSASAGQGTAQRLARYHLVEVRERSGRFDLRLRSRCFDPASGAFRPEGDSIALAGSSS